VYNFSPKYPSLPPPSLPSRPQSIAITAPAHVVNTLLRPLIPEVARLADVYYPPVASVTLAYPKTAFREPLRGFGNLIPRSMKIRTLGKEGGREGGREGKIEGESEKSEKKRKKTSKKKTEENNNQKLIK
jgi:protoporphyrinogen oxidase